jgi:hypothetical protein
MAGKTGALKAILESIRPITVKARSMVGDLAQGLKGNRATGEQWYNQLKNVQGVKPGALEAAFGHLKDGRIQLTKDEFLKAVINPKLSTQRGYSRPVSAEEDDFLYDNALDLLHTSDEGTRATMRGMDEWLADNAGHIRNEDRRGLIEQYLMGDGNPFDFDSEQQVADLAAAHDYALEYVHQSPEMGWALQQAEKLGKKKQFNKYQDFQRQPYINFSNNEYFETVLRKAPKEGQHLTGLMDKSFHFGNPGQIAHARGVMSPHRNGVNMLIDEIQSDPYQALTSNYGAVERAATPELRTPHGDMAKALLLQAAEGGANRLVIPSGPRIAELRGPRYLPAMQDIYDDQLFKQFYKPLDAMGIPTKELGGYRSIEIPPDVREGLTKSGLPFKNGGYVTQPSKMNNTFMCGGLNLINPKNKSKGPLNIQWNVSNQIASARAK